MKAPNVDQVRRKPETDSLELSPGELCQSDVVECLRTEAWLGESEWGEM